MVTSEKNTKKKESKRSLWVSLAAVLLIVAVTLSATSCHNQPKPEEPEQDTTITDEQKLANLVSEKAIAEKEYADALQAAEQAQAEADQKAKIAKKKGTKEAKAEADEAQKKADKLKAEAEAKGEKVKQLDMEITHLKMKLAGVEEETDTPQTTPAKTDKKSAVSTDKQTTNKTENPKVTEERLQKDFESIIASWKNGKNSKQKANQFCTGTLGLKMRNNDPYSMMEQHFKSLDKEQKSEMITQMRNFKFSSDKE